MQWVNNETGRIQDLPGLRKLAPDARIHTDGAQGFFRQSATVDELGVDAATLTAHKSFGPLGVGVLYLRTGVVLDPLCTGGPQERRLRPGTENLTAIHGIGALARLARTEELWPRDTLVRLRDALWAEIEAIPGLELVTDMANSFPNVLAVTLDDLDADTVLMRLGMAGVAASSGSACSAGTHKASTVLRAMGVPDRRIRGALRFSFTANNTVDELAMAGRTLGTVVAELRRHRHTGGSSS